MNADRARRRTLTTTTAIGLVVIAALIVGGLFVVNARGGDSCEAATGEGPVESVEHSVARIWNEQALDAIRRDFPAPTVHARNLFHLSAAMWDTWLVLDPDDPGTAVFVDRANLDSVPEPSDGDRPDARDEALSYAAYTLLHHRYETSAGVVDTHAALDAQMAALCFTTDPSAIDDGSPAAIGVAIAESIIDQTRLDGSNEPAGYVDLSYAPVNPPLVVSEPGVELVDPNRWQPLSLDNAVTRNGQPLASGIQEFVGPNWGSVTPFALPETDDGLPIDPGPPPLLGEDDDAFEQNALEVVRYSSLLDTDTNDAEAIAEADLGRVIAEFWADGPDSETPPGHWNTLANDVSDRLAAGDGNGLRLRGVGEELDRLEWDVKLGLALNGALHDAAIAAWGLKAHYDYVRPISMIRYLAAEGRLPLEPGLSEIITEESAAAGERHEHLSDHVGEVAVYSWQGQPTNPASQLLGVDWILASNWIPYQRETFVTPAFAGYVSGHSTFSRAGAEILRSITGSDEFPGGPGLHVVERGDLIHELGPSTTVFLTWPTYLDAAEQAGISRLYGGIHVLPDHTAGRVVGEAAGLAAWERAEVLFGS